MANPKKTDNGRLITGYACDSRTADAEFLLAKRQYIAATGRVRGTDDVIAYHVRQSFRPGEISPEEANRLGVEFAKRFTKGNHALSWLLSSISLLCFTAYGFTWTTLIPLETIHAANANQ